jgi:hypothetical protein
MKTVSNPGEWTCSAAEACVAAELEPSKVRTWAAREKVPALTRYDLKQLLKLCVLGALARNDLSLGKAASAADFFIDNIAASVVEDLQSGKRLGLVVAVCSLNPAHEEQPWRIDYRPEEYRIADLFKEPLQNPVATVINVPALVKRAAALLRTSGAAVPAVLK